MWMFSVSTLRVAGREWELALELKKSRAISASTSSDRGKRAVGKLSLAMNRKLNVSRLRVGD